MAKLSLKLNRVRTLNPDVFSKAIYRNTLKLWKECVREFVFAAAEQIHVDTGMSKASLLPLSRTVNAIFSIQSKRLFRKGYTDISGVWRPEGTKSVRTGSRLGRRAFKLLFGSHRRPVLKFEFQIVIYQHLLHEFGLVSNTSGPWNSLIAGEKAFLNHFNKNFAKRLPSLNKFILTGTA